MTWGVDEEAYRPSTRADRYLQRVGMAQAFGWAFRTIPRPFFVAGVVWSMAYAAAFADEAANQSFEINDLAWEAPGVGLILLGLLLKAMIWKTAGTAQGVAQTQNSVNLDKVY